LKDLFKSLNIMDTLTGDNKLWTYRSDVYSYLDLLGEMTGLAITDSFCSKVIAVDTVEYIQFKVLDTRLRNDLVVDSSTVEKMLESNYWRGDLIYTLESINKQDIISDRYFVDTSLCSSYLLKYLSDYDESPEQIEFVGRYKVAVDSQYIIIKFNYYIDSEEEYFAAVGPIIKGNQIRYDDIKILLDWEYIKEDWEDQVDKLINKKE